jgi:hypothetical protein
MDALILIMVSGTNQATVCYLARRRAVARVFDPLGKSTSCWTCTRCSQSKLRAGLVVPGLTAGYLDASSLDPEFNGN